MACMMALVPNNNKKEYMKSPSRFAGSCTPYFYTRHFYNNTLLVTMLCNATDPRLNRQTRSCPCCSP
jgi:hypothetical protein